MTRAISIAAFCLLMAGGVQAGDIVKRVVNYTADGKPVIGEVFQAGKSHRKSSRTGLVRRVYRPSRIGYRYRSARLVRAGYRGRPLRCR